MYFGIMFYTKVDLLYGAIEVAGAASIHYRYLDPNVDVENESISKANSYLYLSLEKS